MYSEETRKALYSMASEYQEEISKIEPLLDMIQLFAESYEVCFLEQSKEAQFNYANSAQTLWSLFCLINTGISQLIEKDQRILEKYLPARNDSQKTA